MDKYSEQLRNAIYETMQAYNVDQEEAMNILEQKAEYQDSAFEFLND